MREWRFIRDGGRAGAWNMAVDEALAASARRTGAGTLRVYSFEPPTVTVGRFQQVEGFLDLLECEARGVDVVRRPTGGLAILHMNDFTYSVTTPLERDARASRGHFLMIAGGIVDALESLGIEAEVVSHRARPAAPGWCFEREFGVDVEWRSRKICGSAQRSWKGGLLQHGTLFMEDSSPTLARLTLDGLPSGEAVPVTVREAAGHEITRDEMADAFRSGLAKALGVTMVQGELTAGEEELAGRLAVEKYAAEG